MTGMSVSWFKLGPEKSVTVRSIFLLHSMHVVLFGYQKI